MCSIGYIVCFVKKKWIHVRKQRESVVLLEVIRIDNDQVKSLQFSYHWIPLIISLNDPVQKKKIKKWCQLSVACILRSWITQSDVTPRLLLMCNYVYDYKVALSS